MLLPLGLGVLLLLDMLLPLGLGVLLLLPLFASASQSENKVKSGFFLDIVITQGAAILELFAGKDKTLLIRRNSFLVLNLGFHILNGVRRLDIEGDGLPGEGFYKDLHTNTVCVFCF